MEIASPITVKRGFLYALIGSVGCSALLGILAILMGDFGQFEIRVLLTSLVISGASLCGVACGAVLEARHARNLPLAGIGISLLGAVLLIVGIWVDPHGDAYWKTATTVSIFGAAASHASLLMLARLSPRFRWANPTAHVVIFLLAGLISVMIWGEFNEDWLTRLMGVTAILASAISLLIPIFHRLSREESGAGHGSLTLAEINREIEELEARLAVLRNQKQTLGS